MTQYPSPYAPPPYAMPPGYDPLSPLLAPARRAGLLMIILGSILAVYSLCNGLSALIMPAEEMMAANPLMKDQPGELPSPRTMMTLTVVFSVLMGLVGIGMAVLGVMVRGYRHGAIVTGLVLTCLATFVAGLLALFSLIAGFAAPLFFVVTCVVAVPLGLFVLQLVWLVQALRAGSQLRAAQVQYQAQYWHYQQNQQAYNQAWYGMTAPPPPPPNGTDKPAGQG